MTKLTLDNVYGGFKVTKSSHIDEVCGELYELEHLKSGAKLIYLDCDDDNKVFSVMFKTLPENSTGVFHIIEHSVLCGSKKYPVKEPFVDLLKGSMATFLNALTFSDKTGYPVASCNDKDFANLMEVYLDAVFEPNCLTREEIFMQEGWHYEIEDKNGPMTYRGVVFNEMKGAYSSPDRLIIEEAGSALFPDTLYGYSSGGDPAHIPDLTYEQFKAAHKKYYHPENSYMFLYGNMDIKERLEFIDREYLSKYTRTGLRFDIPMQKPVINMDVTAEYPITESDTEEKNSYIAFSAVVADFSEREKILAFDILISALTSTNESPLKKAVLASGIGSDLSAFIYDGVAQPYVFFELRNTEPDKKEDFLNLLTNELKKLVKNGIDKKILNAEINQAEFHLREGKQGRTPVGLLYNFDIMSTWLYGGDPAMYLEYEQAIANIRKGAEGRYFEDLIEKFILGSEHKAVVVMTPSRTIAAKQAQAEADRIEAYRKTLSDAELEALVEKNRRLVAYQQSENTPEEIATLPKLEISDVGDDITEMPCEVKEYNGRTLLYTNAFTKKIAYINYYFDLSALKPEYLPYASLYATLLGEISTAKHSAADLDAEIKTNLGSFETSVKTFTKSDNIDSVTPVFCVRSSIIESNLDDALTLVGEVIDESRLEKNEIAKFIPQIKNDLQTSIIWSGDSYASLRVASYCSVEGAYQERMEGISYYFFIKELCDRFDKDFDEVKTALEAVAEQLTFDNLTIGITGEQSALDKFEKAAPLFRQGVSGEHYTIAPEYHGNEAFIIPSAVNFVAKGFNLIKDGFEYDESLNVLRNILSLDWLWNEVRVRGGAYGTGFSASRTGDACFTSYRDPGVKTTAETYDKTVGYLKGFAVKTPDIEKYIISTVSSYKRPICPRDLGFAAQTNWFEGRNDDMRRAGKRRVMSTTAQDIEKLSALVKKLTEKNLCAVVGNKEKIDEAGDLFTIKVSI